MSSALSGTIDTRDGVEQLDQWVTESHGITRVDRGDEVRYHVIDRRGLSMRRYLVPDPLSEAIADGSFRVEETVVRDGATLTTLVATDLDPAPWGEDSTDAADPDSATLVVDDTGVIREASIAHPAEEGAVSYAVVEVGLEEPAEPAWTDDVPEIAFASVEIDVDVVAENRAVAVENVGDDSVPAGSTVTVTDDAVDYQWSLDSPLPSGDVRYLSVRDGEPVSSDEQPSEDATEFESPISVSVVSPGGVSFANASMAWSSDSDAAEDGGASGNTAAGSGSDD
ncbi:hypothetical protein [Halovivax limisalsi]|uniref:hypothetical protein n=1 Tax=Halovivax limisalsi TaxID=1453760 RepID=UPI001FFCBD7A|nr:hypothetical protein [Halovivax limisalsi]